MLDDAPGLNLKILLNQQALLSSRYNVLKKLLKLLVNGATLEL